MQLDIYLCLSLSHGTAQASSSLSGNLTRLSTGAHVSLNSTGLTHVLLVTTTVGVINRVHGNTTDVGPLVSLSLVLVERTASLEDGLISSATARYEADGSSVGVLQGHLGSRGHAHSGDTLVLILSHNHGIVTRRLRELSAVARLGLHVADHSSLGDRSKRKDVADGEGSLLSGIDELTGVKTLGGNYQAILALKPVGVLELDASQGGTTALVVEDFGDDALRVPVALSEILTLVSDSTRSASGVGPEDGALTLSLILNSFSHFISMVIFS